MTPAKELLAFLEAMQQRGENPLPMMLRVAARIGYDGNGKDGLAGYLRFIRETHPDEYAKLAKKLGLRPKASDPRPEGRHPRSEPPLIASLVLG